MSAGVTELVPRATEVLLSMDLKAAEYIILGDDEYDRRSLELANNIAPVIVLQAPVATDLGMVVSLRSIHREDIEHFPYVNIFKADPAHLRP